MSSKRWVIGCMLLMSCSGQRDDETTVTHPSETRGTDARTAEIEPDAAEDEAEQPPPEQPDVTDAGPLDTDGGGESPGVDASEGGPVMDAASDVDAQASNVDAQASDMDGAADTAPSTAADAELDSAVPDSSGADTGTYDAGAADAGSDATAEAAANILITFEDLTGMPNATQAVPAASQLSDQYWANTGVVFRSVAPFVAVVTLGQGHATSGTLGIGGVNADGQLSYGSPLEVSFFARDDRTVNAVTDYVKIRGDQLPANGVATLTAYGADGGLLGSAQANDVSGGLKLELSLPGMHRVVVSESQPNIALDDLELHPVTALR